MAPGTVPALVPASVGLSAYRIVQESLENAARYGLLDLRDRAQAVVIAYETGLVAPGSA